MIRAIGFDLDNTLFDHTQAAADAMHQLIGQKGWAYSGDESVGSKWHRIETTYFPQYAAGEMSLVDHRRARMREFLESIDAGLDEDKLDELWNDYVFHYSNAWAAYPDARDALEALKAAGYKMDVLTNGQQAQQEAKLKAMGIADMFEACLAIGTMEALKPDPKAFAHLCRVLDCEPNEVLFVGDDIDLDVRASINAGLQGVWLNRNGLKTPIGINREITTLAELGQSSIVEILPSNFGDQFEFNKRHI